MPRKLKRASIALTDENWRDLEELMKMFGENRSEVIKRALTSLHNKFLIIRRKEND